MLRPAITFALLLAVANQGFALDLLNPIEGERYIKQCANIGCMGRADASDLIVIEIVSSGVIQGRKTVVANDKGQWIANIKSPPAGWIVGNAVVTARIGKVQKSVKIKFVDSIPK